MQSETLGFLHAIRAFYNHTFSLSSTTIILLPHSFSAFLSHGIKISLLIHPHSTTTTPTPSATPDIDNKSIIMHMHEFMI